MHCLLKKACRQWVIEEVRVLKKFAIGCACMVSMSWDAACLATECRVLGRWCTQHKLLRYWPATLLESKEMSLVGWSCFPAIREATITPGRQPCSH
eukprot:2710185-Amphidinium_carterae.1